MQVTYKPRIGISQNRIPQAHGSPALITAKGLQRQEVFQGIKLVILNLPGTGSFEAEYRNPENTFEFSFILSGKVRASVKSPSTESIELNNKSALVHCLPDVPVKFEANPEPRIQMMGIQVDTPVLRQILQPDKDLPPQLIHSLRSGSDSPFVQCGKMQARQTAVVNQIFTSPINGLAGSLFLQSKVLELISLQLDTFTNHTRPAPPGSLSANEEERIRFARELLKQNMTEAPNLLELAELTGLSISKLKKGFKIVFGKTAFSCLHEDRMERAFALLAERRMNVSEVAWEIGYINVGHFSTAFRKKYGMRPKQFQMNGA